MAALWTVVSRYLSVTEFKKGLGIRLAYVLLHQADMLVTNFAVSAGFRELNPIVKGFLDTPAQMLLFKLIIPLFIAWLVPARFLLPALVLLLVVLGLNLKELTSLL
jgi:hypothetical protein